MINCFQFCFNVALNFNLRRYNGVVLGALSQLLWSVTGQRPAAWAKEHLTGPLGVPTFFEHDELGGHISAAGGQMVGRCRSTPSNPC